MSMLNLREAQRLLSFSIWRRGHEDNDEDGDICLPLVPLQ